MKYAVKNYSDRILFARLYILPICLSELFLAFMFQLLVFILISFAMYIVHLP
jgi:hypothetical protein